MKTSIINLTSAALLASCSVAPTPLLTGNSQADASSTAAAGDVAADAGSAAGTVAWHGNLKTIFGGDFRPAVTLRAALPSAHAYALGALGELRGEFVVIDGSVVLAYPTTTELPRVVVAHGSSDESAALLVSASVPRWREHLLDEVPGANLELTIRAAAQADKLDLSRPFPFLLRGTFKDVEWHVADGTRVEPGMPPDVNAQHGTLGETQGTVVAFYSSAHQGVFTMMGQNLHMHVVSSDHTVLGHVRTMDVQRGAVLSLPCNELRTGE